jgi:hypothetical protein
MQKLLVKFTLVVALCLGATTIFLGQSKIKTRLLHSDTSSFSFTSEWQYLSTDVYLFNGQKFTNLINELDFTKEQKGGLFNFKKETNEFLEYLYITASLKNVRFFDKQQITYPLYNFRIDREKDNRYRTYISDDIDHIRIIDNLPLYSAQDFIDAEINVHAITNNTGDQVMKMIARQLQNISKITNPSTAVLSLVGELGSFMESSSRRKEYKFRSTIRLYEKKDFDSRIHSVKIYAMVTDNSENYMVEDDKLQSYLLDLSNRSVDRKKLNKLLKFKSYPYLVVVNYKSLYRMDAVSGDEITFASIEERKIQIENDYKSGLINENTYRLEKDFIKFLTVFANLKKTLEMYNLNFKTGNSEAISNSVFNIVQYYRQMLETYRQIKFKYRNNSTFHRVFEPEYKSILGYAEIYLEKDHYLNNCRNLAETTLKLDTLNVQNLDSAEAERYLNHLHFADVFNQQHMREVPEGETIIRQIEQLEKKHYRKEFEDRIKQVEQLDGSQRKTDLTAKLHKDARRTHCLKCKDSALKVLSDYEKLRKNYKKQNALKKLDSIKKAEEKKIFKYLSQLNDIQYNFNHLYRNDSNSTAVEMIRAKMDRVDKQIRSLQSSLEKPAENVKENNLKKIGDMISSILRTKRMIKDNLQFICAFSEKLCQDKKILKQKEQRRKKAEKAYRQYVEKVKENLETLQRRVDSAYHSVETAENNSNNRENVYQKKITFLQSRISTISNEFNHLSVSNKDSYTKRLQEIKTKYKKLHEHLSEWCQQFPVFCLFLGSLDSDLVGD